MAMLASKSPYPPALGTASQPAAGLSGGASRRGAPLKPITNQAVAPSPTNSEFSDSVDAPDSAKNWDEERVCDWLHTVNCGDYEKAFRRNNINGENLLELDKEGLKEIGIDKIGDRVRLFVAIKSLRTKAYANAKKRSRDSFAPLESGTYSYPSPAMGSPRPLNSARLQAAGSSKRYSRQFDMTGMGSITDLKSSSRPNSPGSDPRSARGRYNVMSPPETARRDPLQAYYGSNPPTAVSTTVRTPATPSDAPQTARLYTQHTRANGSIDGSTMAALPPDQDVIRVISSNGSTRMVKVAECKSTDEVMRVTLRKFGFREDHDRNYCFYALDGLEPDPGATRRLHETELWRIIKDRKRPERKNLILRKIHAGEPTEEELTRAAAIAFQDASENHLRALEAVDKRSQAKVQKVLGESWDASLQHPLSPASFQSGTSVLSATERERNVHNAAKDLERGVDQHLEVRPTARKKGVLRQFFGQRPPSELITSDLITYFPDHSREEIDRTARMSLRRSTRLSRVNHRLSVASNLSIGSMSRDAPPMPTIADTWLTGSNQLPKLRPSRRSGVYRDSVASSAMLEPLQEESSPSDIRASYISMSYDSGSDKGVLSVTDPDGNVMSYYDDGSTEGASLRDAISADGEDQDDELDSFLSGESWDDSKWMQGALIGQGSFGSVYLALHAVTGELLAVKQVEMPSPGGNSQLDAKKKSMIEALKREISLLRDLQHPNIVQYLGASSSADRLNIFLEYVPGGSVQTMLNQYGALREPLVRSFCRQIVTGLAYLHGRDIIHRDIKGANILVDNKGGIKISDFGISKKIEATNLLAGPGNNRNRPSLQGSVFWMAPEVVKQTSYTRKADIWSLGCLVVEMMTGTHPFPDSSQLQAIFKIGSARATPTIPENASPEAVTFLASTFEIDHTKRPSADELLISPFLNPIT